MRFRPLGFSAPGIFRCFFFCSIFMIAACSAPQPSPSVKAEQSSYSASELQLFTKLKSDLPGFYSNFAQVTESGADEDTVTDLIIRELISKGPPVFLFESQQRNSPIRQYDLYWSQVNPQSRQLELQFARLSGSELSFSVPETLDLAKQRALPGCVMSLQQNDSVLTGNTQSETCQFQNPLYGQIFLYRSIEIDGEELELANLELAPGELLDAGNAPQRFQKHQFYQGELSISPDVISGTDDSGQWQTSPTITLGDDGRVLQMFDEDMNPMQYTIRLSRLQWRENEPPYLRLDVIQAKSGEIQAYSWFKNGLEEITFEQDWVKVNLNKTTAE